MCPVVVKRFGTISTITIFVFTIWPNNATIGFLLKGPGNEVARFRFPHTYTHKRKNRPCQEVGSQNTEIILMV